MTGRTGKADDFRHIRSRRHPRGQRTELLRVRAADPGAARNPRFHLGTTRPLHRHQHAGDAGGPEGPVRDPGAGGRAPVRAERRLSGAGPDRDRGVPRDAQVRGAAAHGARPDGGGVRVLARGDRRGAGRNGPGRAADHGGLGRGGAARQARPRRLPRSGPPARRSPADCVVVEDAAPGAQAAHAAGMACMAIPYVPTTADDPAFATAALLFRSGHSEFTAETAYAWLCEHPAV